MRAKALDALIVPGHDGAKVVNVSSWSVWNFNCPCGANGGGYDSAEYALAALRRHRLRAYKKSQLPAPVVQSAERKEK